LLCPHSLRYDGPGAGGRCKTKTGLPRLLGICRELAKWGHNIKSDYGGGAMTISQNDNETKSSFLVETLLELPSKLKEMREKFGKD